MKRHSVHLAAGEAEFELKIECTQPSFRRGGGESTPEYSAGTICRGNDFLMMTGRSTG